jgi:hypothetical protein
VRHLEREVLYWRQLYQHERDRAEVAIDQCRTMHQSLPPVTRPPAPAAAIQQTIESLLGGSELGAIGQEQGVER